MAQQRRSPRAVEREAARRPDYFKTIQSRTDTQEVTRVVFRNGLTLLVRELHTTPVAAVVTYVKTGYFNERDDQIGISHVIEHMYFKGTKKRGLGRVAGDTRKLGGVLNASTIYDHTLYYTVIPSENVIPALEIQADALQNSALDAEELRKELLVIIQEAKRKLDNPSVFGLEKMYELAFENHRMRRWRIGTEAGLKAMSREQLVNYYSDFYKPSNIILSICGDVSVEAMVAEVARRYGSLPAGKPLQAAGPAEPAQTQLKYQELRGDINQSYVFVGFHVPGVTDKDYYPLSVLATMLGQGKGAWLNQRLKEKQKLVTSISAHVTDFKSAGMFTIDFRTTPDQLDKAELSLLTELEALKTLEISDEDLARAQALIEQNFYRQNNTAQGIAEILARFEDLGGIKWAQSHLDHYRKVTLDDLRRVLKKYIQANQATVLEYQPRNAEPRGFTAESFRGTIEPLLHGAVQQRLAEKIDAPDYAAGLQPPNDKYVFEPRQAPSPVTRPSILRGPEIFIREDHTTPTITVGFFLPGGRLHEDESNSGITELLLRSALKGTIQPPPDKLERSAAFIAMQMELWGGQITPVVADDYFGYHLTVLSKNVEPSLKLLLDILRNPKFDEAEVAKEKAALLARARMAKDDNFSHPLELFRRAIFKKLPYAQPRFGSEDAIKKLTPEALKAWHNAHMARTKPIITIIGDTQGTSLATFFAKNLQRMDYSPAKLPKAKDIQLSDIVTEVEPREKRQTAMVIGFPMSGVSAEDAYALDVLRHLTSGLGGRFFEELRDRQSLAYTVSVGYIDNVLGGALYGYIATSPENEAKALEAFKEQFKKLKTDSISSAEFSEAVNSAAGSYVIALQNRSVLSHKLVMAVLLGRPYEEVNDYAGKLKSVTRDDVKGMAERFVDPAHYALGVVRGSSAPAASTAPARNPDTASKP